MDEMAQRSLEEPGDSCGDSAHWPYDVHGTHTHPQSDVHFLV